MKAVATALMLAMVWLTVSVPFVFKQQKELAKENIRLAGIPPEEETHNPFSKSSEEKNESGKSGLSIFFHDYVFQTTGNTGTVNYCTRQVAGLYTAFHGELLSPPPEL